MYKNKNTSFNVFNHHTRNPSFLGEKIPEVKI